jgi:hypothetical protein
MEHISPIPVLIFSLTVYLMMSTVWSVFLLFIACFVVGVSVIFCRRCGHTMFFFFYQRQKTTSCQWVWRDRTYLDTYAYSLLNKASTVALNMKSILLEQTHATSVAIILGVSQRIIEQHLRKMNVPLIKISELRSQLDYYEGTYDINWNEYSINVLLETIERVITQRELPCAMIDDLFIRWQI